MTIKLLKFPALVWHDDFSFANINDYNRYNTSRENWSIVNNVVKYDGSIGSSIQFGPACNGDSFLTMPSLMSLAGFPSAYGLVVEVELRILNYGPYANGIAGIINRFNEQGLEQQIVCENTWIHKIDSWIQLYTRSNPTKINQPGFDYTWSVELNKWYKIRITAIGNSLITGRKEYPQIQYTYGTGKYIDGAVIDRAFPESNFSNASPVGHIGFHAWRCAVQFGKISAYKHLHLFLYDPINQIPAGTMVKVIDCSDNILFSSIKSSQGYGGNEIMSVASSNWGADDFFPIVNGSIEVLDPSETLIVKQSFPQIWGGDIFQIVDL